MKQHVTGLVLFTLIIGLTASAFYISHSIADSPDVNAVPPVFVEPPNITSLDSDKTIPYRVDLIQYDVATQTLLARLMIIDDKQVPSDHFTVTALIEGDEGFAGSPLTVDAQKSIVRRNLGNSIEVEFEARVPVLAAYRNRNFYASFVIHGLNDDQSSKVERSSVRITPVLFIHEKSLKKAGPDILQ